MFNSVLTPLRRSWQLLVPLVGVIVVGGVVAGTSLATSSTSSASSKSSSTVASSAVPVGATATQGAVVHVVQTVLPSVVQIQDKTGLGSGIVFDTAGHIVTNNHVVTGATSFTVTTSAGKQYPAKLVGSFPPDDLAVIKVTGANLKPATFGNSSRLTPGDTTIAIGNPLGLRSSVTDGIVSGFRQAMAESAKRHVAVRDPDERSDQSGQFRRRAGRHPGPRDRDSDAHRNESRDRWQCPWDRLRDPERHGQGHR